MFPSVICRNNCRRRWKPRKPGSVNYLRSDVARRIFSLHLVHLKILLGMCGAHVATGVLSFITLRKIVGLLTGELGGSSEFTIQLS
jgi:hypothetical protein